MKKSIRSFMLAAAVVFAAVSVLAAGPSVRKSVSVSADGVSVIVLKVTGASRDVYTLAIDDPSGSIQDIVAPKGWCGIADGSRIVFHTSNKPIRQAKSVYFRIVSSNKDAQFDIGFKDAKALIATKKSI